MGGLERAERPYQTSLKNPRMKRKQRTQSANHHTKPKNSKKRKLNVTKHQNKNVCDTAETNVTDAAPSDPFSFFLNEFQTANDVQLSSLELESMKGPPESSILDDKVLGQHIKLAFSSSWREVLCEGKLSDVKIEPGSPSVLMISTSALRSIELLKCVRQLTRECNAVKLFSKHMKVDEQVALLKNRVNIASGTPSRIKKLIDIEALGLSRLAVIVLDIHPDIKGYSLLSLPQVRDEFWDLYKSYFHQRVVEGDIKICLYGPLQSSKRRKCKQSSTVT